MSDKIHAPWRHDEVDALNRFQRAGFVHEFTCPVLHEGFVPADRTLVATIHGWICPHCNYTQDWAHRFMLAEPVNPFDKARYETPRGRISIEIKEAPITWKKSPENFCDECFVGDRLTAWLTNRPSYCDRGHFMVDCNLPDLDGADGFPRFYMKKGIAISETETWLKWRLWKKRS